MIGSGEVSDFVRTERYLLISQGMKIGPSVKSRVCRLEYVSYSPKSPGYTYVDRLIMFAPRSGSRSKPFLY